MACNNDFDCGAFAFKNKDYLNGTTWCMKYSKHECEISEHDEWRFQFGFMEGKEAKKGKRSIGSRD